MKRAPGYYSVSHDNGHRGYAERSRRERTWDPGSAFYAEGASKHYTGPRLPNGRCRGGGGGGAHGARNKKHRVRRPGSRGSVDVHPVDIDWEKVTSEPR